MDFNEIIDFIVEHIDVIISALVGLFTGMQIEKIIIKKNNNYVFNSPNTNIRNGDTYVNTEKKQ